MLGFWFNSKEPGMVSKRWRFKVPLSWQKWTNLCVNRLSAGCLPPSAAAAWRRSLPQSLWCAPWSVCTTSTASAAACATGSWGRATSLCWRKASCSASSTTRGRRTCWARSALMTQTQVRPLSPFYSWVRTTPRCDHQVTSACCVLFSDSTDAIIDPTRWKSF